MDGEIITGIAAGAGVGAVVRRIAGAIGGAIGSWLGRGGGGAASTGTISRALTAADLGISGSVRQLSGTFTVTGSQATARINMIQGTINNPFQIISNLSNLARAQGASVLRIEGSLANPRFNEVLVRRYGMTSAGATDVIIIPLR